MRSFLVVFGLLLLASCNSNIVLSDSRSLPEVWNKDEVIEFTITPKDSVTPVDLFLHLRNTNRYKYNNLFLIASLHYPNGKVQTDTLEYRMANPDGTWLGTGIGNIKENKLYYKEQFIFSEKGDYTLYLEHAMRNNGKVNGVSDLEGITDVGYSIENEIKE